MHCLLVLVAIAPFRRTVKIEAQRGDQGGLRTHDTCLSHPGMKQDATFAEEISQAAGMQLLQLKASVRRAEMRSETTAHASLKAVEQVPERADFSADLLCAGTNISVVPKPEASAPETASCLPPLISSDLLNYEEVDRSVMTADARKN